MNISVKNLQNMIHRIAGECETPLDMEKILNAEIKAYTKFYDLVVCSHEEIEMFPEVIIPDGKDFAVVGKYTEFTGQEHFIIIRDNYTNNEYIVNYSTYSKIKGD